MNTRDMHDRQGSIPAQAERRQGVERRQAAERRQAMEDSFYERLVEGGTPVHIRCVDGYEIPQAVLRAFGTYSLLVEADGCQELVFKHGIISIRPLSPVPAPADRPASDGERFG